MKTEASITVMKKDDGKYRYTCNCLRKITVGDANTLRDVFYACTKIIEESKASHSDEDNLNGSYSEKQL